MATSTFTQLPSSDHQASRRCHIYVSESGDYTVRLNALYSVWAAEGKAIFCTRHAESFYFILQKTAKELVQKQGSYGCVRLVTVRLVTVRLVTESGKANVTFILRFCRKCFTLSQPVWIYQGETFCRKVSKVTVRLVTDSDCDR